MEFVIDLNNVTVFQESSVRVIILDGNASMMDHFLLAKDKIRNLLSSRSERDEKMILFIFRRNRIMAFWTVNDHLIQQLPFCSGETNVYEAICQCIDKVLYLQRSLFAGKNVVIHFFGTLENAKGQMTDTPLWKIIKTSLHVNGWQCIASIYGEVHSTENYHLLDFPLPQYLESLSRQSGVHCSLFPFQNVPHANR